MLEVLYGTSDDMDSFSWTVGQQYGWLQVNPYEVIEVQASGEELNYVLSVFPHLCDQLAYQGDWNGKSFDSPEPEQTQHFYGETAQRIAGCILDQ